MDRNMENHSMFKLSCKSRTHKKIPYLFQIFSSGRLTESAHQKVSCNAVWYILTLFSFPMLWFVTLQSRRQLPVFHTRKFPFYFLQEEENTHQNSSHIHVILEMTSASCVQLMLRWLGTHAEHIFFKSHSTCLCPSTPCSRGGLFLVICLCFIYHQRAACCRLPQYNCTDKILWNCKPLSCCCMHLLQASVGCPAPLGQYKHMQNS